MPHIGKMIGRGATVRRTTTIVPPPKSGEVTVKVQHITCALKKGELVAPGEGPLDREFLSQAQMEVCDTCNMLCKV